jgi:hypothetical protein
LVEIHRLVGGSIVRYAVQGAGVEVRNESDREAMALYQEWFRAETGVVTEAQRSLETSGNFPSRPTWPLWFSQLNYVGARFLLGHVAPHMESLLSSLKDLASSSGSLALPLLDAAIHMEERFLERAREMLAR